MTRLRVEVLAGSRARQRSVQVVLRRGGTVADAVRASGLLAGSSARERAELAYAIHGVRVDAGQRLEAGDRVEILAPLRVSPREARRRRAAARRRRDV